MLNTGKDMLRRDRAALVAELESAGAKFKGTSCTCPFHEDTHPSAGVFEDDMGTWRFKCQAAKCGARGDYWDIKARVFANSRFLQQNRDLKPAHLPRPTEPNIWFCYVGDPLQQGELDRIRAMIDRNVGAGDLELVFKNEP